MPKKTKKEKIIAQARRIIKSSEIARPLEQTIRETPKPSVPSFTFTGIAKKPVDPKSEQSDINEFKAIRLDIIKTVVLAACAIAAEVFIYIRLKM